MIDDDYDVNYYTGLLQYVPFMVKRNYIVTIYVEIDIDTEDHGVEYIDNLIKNGMVVPLRSHRNIVFQSYYVLPYEKGVRDEGVKGRRER